MIPVVQRESDKVVEQSIAESLSIDSIDEILNRDMESIEDQDIKSETSQSQPPTPTENSYELQLML
jgi:hypothetical protein